MDSGTSHHMTCDLANFFMHVLYTYGEEVLVGDMMDQASKLCTLVPLSFLYHHTHLLLHMSYYQKFQII